MRYPPSTGCNSTRSIRPRISSRVAQNGKACDWEGMLLAWGNLNHRLKRCLGPPQFRCEKKPIDELPKRGAADHQHADAIHLYMPAGST
jgi:hypothetical protein